MSPIKKNILANYVGRIWGFVSTFIFVSFYLKILGVEAYAIIQFYAVLLGIMAFADAGLTATINREFARSDVDDNYKANLLRTFEYCYLVIILFITIIVAACSSLIAKKWLNAESMAIGNVAYYIKLIGISIALQMFASLYQGGLMGLQKQVLANGLSIGYSLVRSGLALLPLCFWPSLKVFFIWQIAINILYLLLLKKTTAALIKTDVKPAFRKDLLCGVWHYAAGIMGMSILSAILIQADKLIASKVLPLTEFGCYSFASTLGQVPLMITVPIGIALFPRLTQAVSDGNKVEQMRLFRLSSFVVIGIGIVATLVLICFAQKLLFLWTRKPEIAQAGYQATQILSIGTLFQVMQLMPYYVGLANKHTRTNLYCGIGSVLFMIPALFFAASRWGLTGIAFPWVVMSITTFIILTIVIWKKFLIIK